MTHTPQPEITFEHHYRLEIAMNTHQKTLYWLAFADGCALLMLVFVAVPVKYLLDFPLGVKLLGPIHGGLFISLTLTTVAALSRKVVKPGLAALLLIGALIPLGAFYADYRLRQAYANE
jgi:integral membrane protein